MGHIDYLFLFLLLVFTLLLVFLIRECVCKRFNPANKSKWN